MNACSLPRREIPNATDIGLVVLFSFVVNTQSTAGIVVPSVGWYWLDDWRLLCCDSCRRIGHGGGAPSPCSPPRPTESENQQLVQSYTTLLSKKPLLRRPFPRPGQRNDQRHPPVACRTFRDICLGVIPEGLTKLTHLKEFFLMENKFTGAQV